MRHLGSITFISGVLTILIICVTSLVQLSGLPTNLEPRSDGELSSIKIQKSEVELKPLSQTSKSIKTKLRPSKSKTTSTTKSTSTTTTTTTTTSSTTTQSPVEPEPEANGSEEGRGTESDEGSERRSNEEVVGAGGSNEEANNEPSGTTASRGENSEPQEEPNESRQKSSKVSTTSYKHRHQGKGSNRKESAQQQELETEKELDSLKETSYEERKYEMRGRPGANKLEAEETEVNNTNNGSNKGGDRDTKKVRKESRSQVANLGMTIALPVIAIAIVGLIIFLARKWWQKFKNRDGRGSSAGLGGFADLKNIQILGQQYKDKMQPESENLASNMEINEEAGDKDESKKDEEKLGRLKFRLDYDFNNTNLAVGVLQAQELPGMDMCGTSDPYVKVYLMPDKKKKFETKVHRKTLNPVFNETFNFKVAYAEVTTKTLVFAVYDFDR